MGRNKTAKKDRGYVTASEWAAEGGGGGRDRGADAPFRRLPFHCCAISFLPFKNAVCAPDGTVMDISNAVPYVMKHKKHPVSGEALAVKDLVRLNWYKNKDGEYECPVLNKTFTDATRICAVKTTGNVYCTDAIEELCFKTKNWKDLLTDEAFKRSDVVTLQDPLDLKARTLDNFDHVKRGLDVKGLGKEGQGDDGSINKTQVSEDMRRVLASLGSEEAAKIGARGGSSAAAQAQEAKDAEENKKHGIETKPDTVDNSHLLRGPAAMGFTSTTMEAHTKNHRAEEIVWYNPTKKGYVRLHTNFGDLNIELHCDKTPRTCENFITLAEKGFYDGVKFHRSIKRFMLQGGDPTGTGRGGHCIWGEKFADEIKGNPHRHDERGVLSMANSGKNTNGSQFFITYNAAPHLDNKHTVFGRVVGGMETLARIEEVECDAADRPLKTIKITSCTIFTNPYDELREEDDKKERAEAEAKAKAADVKNGTGQALAKDASALPAAKASDGVGKYVASASTSAPAASAPPPKKAKTGGFGNFDAW
ncbi:predicted protein [Ostreococcus lucimarinus CCE9901]|uniref:RING-type E3 ubiquitin transferase n=1 Tax=Ostreococcus lucimarinus (strain CCE9901) TaxID=436017 RepID=A4RTS6_OSTLU|nr:predicted protein [Ostreococcus lucimarinus CCE9901]ABO95128.1 predicted protein [Ostreococcus lucimarinus CCE9901]|eukprot:XP_001416835.1 predicted protein [Ostreococcus lucimarinus CCE9901]